MKTIQNAKGFTLVELILCIAIVGMLTAAIAPSFGSLMANSAKTSVKGTVGAIQSAINVKMGENLLNGSSELWPTTLDDDGGAVGVCSSRGCFAEVLSQPLTAPGWYKTSEGSYSYDANGIYATINYNAGTGQLTCTGCDD